ncbi:imidazolonepropionase-like amidohydrolase [Rhizobium sp. BK181]|uniref:metal-dependent hydrolase family protein n=1 Tax=Rhizobium sp. BK181 TaxID=2587072 RepID=UPI00162114FC|nr:amidohydrolase family protein [Rhizobium sp. BK181]MBB3316811.1 imidazolonepropionase-like amidohydrolase [Rhizobium sp. BK181]
MFRLGRKYRHLVHDAGCGCANPFLQRRSGYLSDYSRRTFLAGIGSATVAGMLPGVGSAQTPAPPSRLLLTQVRLFDGKSDTLQTGVQVLVEGNKISAIDKTNSAPPSDATIMECGDRVLMPGMIDAHWHTIYAAVPLQTLMVGDPGIIFASSTAEAERTLMRGFTTVRDLGGPVFTFKQAIDEGTIPGPRIFPSGAMITTSGGHADLRKPFEIPARDGQLSLSEMMGSSAIVDDVGDLKRRVREQLLQGASQIKLVGGGGVSSPRSPLDMTTFSEDEIRAAVDVARDWNTYVTVHAYAPKTVQRALVGGAACVEHAHLMDEDTARMFVDKNVWLSTQPFLTMDDAASQTGPGAERIKQLFAGTPKIYEFAKKHGIRTAWGSDVLFSPALTPRQNTMLTHLANWYTNAEALRMATSGNADLLALSSLRTPYGGKLGVIEEGAFADILVWDGNPLDDLQMIEDPQKNLSVVIKDGRIFKNTL